jgi:hypothetical protein
VNGISDARTLTRTEELSVAGEQIIADEGRMRQLRAASPRRGMAKYASPLGAPRPGPSRIGIVARERTIRLEWIGFRFHIQRRIASPLLPRARPSHNAPDPQERPRGSLGRQCCFGMTLHVGADSKTKLIHPMTTATAREANPPGQLQGIAATSLSARAFSPICALHGIRHCAPEHASYIGPLHASTEGSNHRKRPAL